MSLSKVDSIKSNKFMATTPLTHTIGNCFIFLFNSFESNLFSLERR